ncbi:MAG: sigma-54 dependent transcriptional regulator [Thermodesulfobacteriota bacterium]
MASVLIVDDEETHARAIGRFLGRRSYSPVVATSAGEARAAVARARPDLVLLDLRLGEEDGVAILRELHATDPGLPVIIMTAYGSVDSAVAAMKAGARDYIQKPLDLEELALIIERALEESRARACLEHLQQGPASGSSDGSLIGSSAAMRPVHDFVARMASLGNLRAGDYPSVLLLGETGTGKSLLARTLHRASPLARRPFMVLDCTALPRDLIEAELFGYERGAFTDARAAKPGLVEVAAGGTIFLDEIGELGADAQAKLLRVIEERTVRRLGGLHDVTVDVRIVAATNRDPAAEVAAGRLRSDLYYRLNVLTLSLPPLRERGDDVLLLARHFLEQCARKYARPAKSLSADAVACLLRESWVGNVRELAHVIERATLMVDDEVVEARHLRATPIADVAQPAVDAGAPGLEAAERQLIKQALEEAHGNVSGAARRLGVSRELLRYRARKHGLR